MDQFTMLARKEEDAQRHQKPAATDAKQQGGTAMDLSGGDNKQLWTRVKKRLWASVGEDVFNSWFARLELVELDGDLAHLSVPTRFLCSWILSNYQDRIIEAFQGENQDVQTLQITVRVNGQVQTKQTAKQDEPAAQTTPTPKVSATIRTGAKHNARIKQGDALSGSALDPKLTFDTFVAGSANEMALGAAKQVAQAVAQNAVTFNPVYIHSSVGLGKSHLLNAIAWAAGGADKSRNVVYLTADHFMYHFISAVQRQSAISFKEWLRGIDVLLIDDMQFLQGKSVTEFGQALSALLSGAKQVVVAGDAPPNGLEMLDDRLRSRLSGGLVVPIRSLDEELRRAIVEKRAEQALAKYPGLHIPSQVLDYVAKKVISHGRDLDGSINRLVAANQLTGEPITIDLAEKALHDLMRTRDTRRVKIDEIQIMVAKHFKVSKPDLLSSRRSRSVVRPRQIAMYLSKMLTSRSLPEIGRRFGNRDHTTVLHAVRKVEQLMSEDNGFAQEVELLKRMIED
ncbi:chromosomal replication initiator protein DnaA [Maritalea porphyrae]|uniref:Chromosomal replication initiator protein DnaA n=1 Tax=Maritalea porphyrae TaxID=880732 RepID=A0ABQ5UP25_9HYPH|nr:chromosomal replication initiator protein DnaA [Maritalea porphyrae]